MRESLKSQNSNLAGDMVKNYTLQIYKPFEV